MSLTRYHSFSTLLKTGADGMDSNPRPIPYGGIALPTELRQRKASVFACSWWVPEFRVTGSLLLHSFVYIPDEPALATERLLQAVCA